MRSSGDLPAEKVMSASVRRTLVQSKPAWSRSGQFIKKTRVLIWQWPLNTGLLLKQKQDPLCSYSHDHNSRWWSMEFTLAIVQLSKPCSYRRVPNPYYPVKDCSLVEIRAGEKDNASTPTGKTIKEAFRADRHPPEPSYQPITE